MNDEQEMRAKAIELAAHIKSRILAAAIISGRSASGDLFDEEVDKIYAYISHGEKPKKKEKDE
jgi:hypothetical protein